MRLKSDHPDELVPPADKAEQITKQLLDRVSTTVGQSPDRYNVFRNLGYFVVSANPSFIKELSSQPEVVSIVANRQPGSALIPPVDKGPVEDVAPGRKAPTKKASTSAKRTSAKRTSAKRKTAKKSRR